MIVLDNWVVADLEQDSLFAGHDLYYSIDGGADIRRFSIYLGDNFTTAASSDLTPNDGYILMGASPLAVTAGQTFTLRAGIFEIPAIDSPLFNPLAQQTFEGNVFLANNIGQRISNVVAVP